MIVRSIKVMGAVYASMCNGSKNEEREHRLEMRRDDGLSILVPEQRQSAKT
jgi:hypothetical protein